MPIRGKKVLMMIIIKGDSECGGLSLKAGALNGTTFCIRCLLRKAFLSFSFHFYGGGQWRVRGAPDFHHGFYQSHVKTALIPAEKPNPNNEVQ